MKLIVLGVRITISYWFALFFVMLFLVDRTGYYLLFSLAVLCHEIGHFMAMCALRCPPTEIWLIPGECRMVTDFFPVDHGWLISLSGPLTNLCLGFVVWLSCRCVGDTRFYDFARINMALGIFNLMPIPGLDGGELLHRCLVRRWGNKSADRSMRILLLIALAGVIVLGVSAYRRHISVINYGIVALYFLSLLCVKI